MMTLSHAGVQITASLFKAIANLPWQQPQDRLFVEREQDQLADGNAADELIGSPAWCKRKCPELLDLHWRIGSPRNLDVALLHSCGLTSIPEPKLSWSLRAAYRRALEHFVVDSYNLHSPLNRKAPSGISLRKVCANSSECLRLVSIEHASRGGRHSFGDACEDWATLRKEMKHERSARGRTDRPLRSRSRSPRR